MAFRGGEYAVTGTATSIATALGITGGPSNMNYLQVILRNNPGAANEAWWGPAALTTTTNRAGVLAAGDLAPAVLSGEGGHALDISKIFLVGTAGAANIIFISLVQ